MSEQQPSLTMPKAYGFHELVADAEKCLNANGNFDATDADIKEVLEELTSERTQEFSRYQSMVDQRRRIEELVHQNYLSRPEIKGN